MHEVDDKLGLHEELYRVLRQDGFLSIFPMDMGTQKMLEIVYSPPGYKTGGEITNFNKIG